MLENSAPTPGCVADIKELPHDKQAIKSAILTCLAHVSDPELKEQLKTGYMCLADWQIGVGDQHLGIDLSKVDQNADIETRAEQTL